MEQRKKAIRKYAKLLIKGDFKKADLRTLKVLKFTKEKISIIFKNGDTDFAYNYTDNIAEKFYNYFLEVEQAIEKL